VSAVVESGIDVWTPGPPGDDGAASARVLEEGGILFFPVLRFPLEAHEERFLDPRWSDGRAKNVSLEVKGDALLGATASRRDLEELRALLTRFRDSSSRLARALFPRWARALRTARTSFRPVAAAGRVASWRNDDTRLHVDAFPARPTRGARILRVFVNVNPRGVPRTWRIGEPFTDVARRFLPRLSRPVPGSARLLHLVGATDARRSPYDQLMLRLHDAMKRDVEYQGAAREERFEFPAGSTWMCFSDQVSHAATAGQFLLEQTMHVPVDALERPELSPLRTLEALAGRSLV
jgi:3-deoxy-D-manno-oct-2-ulosonic acid (Kdo) hydroxylase